MRIMSNNALENPLLLFGDVSPDVLKLTQLYDPDNDQYVRTNINAERYQQMRAEQANPDSWALSTFFKRGAIAPEQNDQTFPANVVTFSPLTQADLTAAGANPDPSALGWCVLNEHWIDQSGKYIPAVHSVITVDVGTERYKEFTLLVVAAVDNQITYVEGDGGQQIPVIPTYKATLVPVNLGTGEEITARAIDYGNDSLFLYTATEQDGTVTRLIPDKKLMLYGQRYYVYRLTKNNVPVAVRKLGVYEDPDVVIPFVSAAASKITLTAENITELANCQFDIMEVGTDAEGKNWDSWVRRFVIPTDPANSFIATFDKVFVSGKEYYFANKSGAIVPVYRETSTSKIVVQTRDKKAVSGKTYFLANTQDVSGNPTSWKVLSIGAGNTIPSDQIIYEKHSIGNPVPDSLIFEPFIPAVLNRTGYIYNPTRTTVQNIFLPDESFLRQGNFTCNDGEEVRFEVFELGNEGYDRIVTARDKNGNVVNEPNRYVVPINMISGTSVRLVMSVILTCKEALPINVAEGTSKLITDFVVENEDTSSGDDNVWYIVAGETREDLKLTAKLKFDDGSEKIIPIDNKSCYEYGMERIPPDSLKSKDFLTLNRLFPILYKYFPPSALKSDWSDITAVAGKGFVTCRKTLQVVPSAAEKIRKISMIPVWDYAKQTYRNFYITYTTDFDEPAIVDGNQLEGESIIPGLNNPVTYQIAQAPYEITPQDALRTFDYVMHGVIVSTARYPGYKTAVYTQPISFMLKNWISESTGSEKWRIGDDIESWDLQTLTYGNASDAGCVRPLIRYDPAAGTFFVDSDYFATPSVFIQNFYRPCAPGKLEDATQLTPTHFRVRAIDTNAVSICSGASWIQIDDGSTNPPFLQSWTLDSGYAYRVVGGAKPALVEGAYRVMGTVVVEFATIQKINGVDVPKYLYGVPVEVRDVNWT